MAYGLHTRTHVSTVMVYDIGGGTLDVSLLHLNNGIFEVSERRPRLPCLPAAFLIFAYFACRR